MHLIDYCPPWPSGKTKAQQEPCSTENRLGSYALWFKHKHLYGIHGRHPQSDDQDGFYQFTSDERKRSDGCVVARHDHLESFAHLILKDAAFAGHEIAKKILDVSKDAEPMSLAIPIVGADKKTPPSDLPGSTVGKEAEIDIKLYVINTKESQIWPPLNRLEEKHPILKLLQTEEDFRASAHGYRTVVNCKVKKSMLIYNDAPSSEERQKVGRIDKGDVLVGVYKHTSSPSEDVAVQFRTKETEKLQVGWIRDEGTLDCEDEFYWSIQENAKIQ